MRVIKYLFFILIACCKIDPSPTEFESTRGASVPWIRYEAENGVTNGTILSWDRNLNDGVGEPAGEASGRKCVRLDGTGESIQWGVAQMANTLVIRYSIPDAPGGYGAEYTLSFYHKKKKLTTFTLSSKYSWLYGNENTPSETPSAGRPRRIYDEFSVVLPITIYKGDPISLVKEPGDTAAFYDIDFIECEYALPLNQPVGSINVLDYGADPTGEVDSLQAFKDALIDTGVGGTLWVPPGLYKQSKKIYLTGQKVVGAGVWYTTLWGYESWDQNIDMTGFRADESGSSVSHLKIRGENHIRDTGCTGISGRMGSDSSFTDLWIEHTDIGIFSGWPNDYTPTRVKIENVRVRSTGADGINLCFGTQNGRIKNCSVRYTGDDGIVIWSRKTGSTIPATNNEISDCTVELNWRANGFTLCGGKGTTLTNCVVRDTLTYPGLFITSSFWPWPFDGETKIDGLDLIRCGGTFWSGNQYGAIIVCAENSDISAPITISNVNIIDPTHSGIEFVSRTIKNEDFSESQPPTYCNIVPGNVTFNNITITNAGTYGIKVNTPNVGGAAFNNVTVNAILGPLQDLSGGTFELNRVTGNNW